MRCCCCCCQLLRLHAIHRDHLPLTIIAKEVVHSAFQRCLQHFLVVQDKLIDVGNVAAAMVVIDGSANQHSHHDADTNNSLFEAAPAKPQHEQRKHVTIVTEVKYSDGSLKAVFCDLT